MNNIIMSKVSLTEERDKIALKLVPLLQEQKLLEAKTGVPASPLSKLGQEIKALNKKFDWLTENM